MTTPTPRPTTAIGADMTAVVDRVVDTLMATDAYKFDHRRQYPDGTEVVEIRALP